MEYILSSKSSLPSALLLRTALEEISGRKFRVTSHPEKLNRNPTVRYGNSTRILGGVDTDLNSENFITLVSNKRTFSELIKEKVYTPEFSFSPPEEKDFPIVVRKVLSGCKGRGIVICKSMEEYTPLKSYAWTKFITLDFELRVHVIGGEIKKIFRKRFSGEQEEEFPIRTSEHYHFSIVHNEKFPKLSDTVSQVVEIIGKDHFYALDIGWDRKNKKYFVLEANSAPGLNSETVKIYADYIHEKIKEI